MEYALQGFAHFVKPYIVTEGMTGDESVLAAYLTQDFREWRNTVHDVDGELVAVDGNDGQVLLAAGIHSVGDEGFHLLAAAHHRHAGIVDHADEVAAVTADIELGFHNETSCKKRI